MAQYEEKRYIQLYEGEFERYKRKKDPNKALDDLSTEATKYGYSYGKWEALSEQRRKEIRDEFRK